MLITAMGPPRAAESVVKISPIPMNVSFPKGIEKFAVDAIKARMPNANPIATGIQMVFFTFIERLLSS
jgi:hypothetical protein